MFSRIHNKLGTAGLVVAIVALVAALAGTAFAALPGLNAKQKKEVKKIAKKLVKAGPQGPQGATGPTGAQGAAGAAGSNGTNGSNGLQGATGEAGACSDTKPECVLPPGATLTGTWSFWERGRQTVETEVEGTKTSYSVGPARTRINISFPLRVIPPPDGFSVAQNWVPDTGIAPDPEACPGSVSDPEAAPGEICIYAQEVLNAGSNAIEEPEELEAPDPSSGLSLAFLLAEGPAQGRGVGTWAVTAPCPENEGVEEEC